MTIDVYQVLVGDEWRNMSSENAVIAFVNRPGSVRLVTVQAPTRIRHELRPRSALNGRPITPQRLAAAERRLKADRELVPLFAHLLKAEQPTAQERVESWERDFVEKERQWRAFDAARWREVRRILRAMPPQERAEWMLQWNDHGCPATSHFAIDMLRDTPAGKSPPVAPAETQKGTQLHQTGAGSVAQAAGGNSTGGDQ